ncbi:zinc finger and BTB domain-containing protein 49 [Clonorchis sinensis]|uniref:Zinc finger and BTB domain-containing protein 49 n=1 Tax=Clonorchis sinensis TaxID=79923 RepID=H2KT38_CLOSI|nr:zinc finger and BTB domain-containing protein 49 [Clonorchis sinensis]
MENFNDETKTAEMKIRHCLVGDEDKVPRSATDTVGALNSLLAYYAPTDELQALDMRLTWTDEEMSSIRKVTNTSHREAVDDRSVPINATVSRTSWTKPLLKDNRRGAQCNICGIQLESARARKWHKSLHHHFKPTYSRAHARTICGKNYAFPPHLKAHSLKDSWSQPFSCGVCGENFTHCRNIKDHIIKLHSIHHLSLNQCGICQKTFNSLPNLRQHIHSHLPRVKTYQCMPCNQRFNTRGNLHRHKFLYHAGYLRHNAINHECTVCKRWFECNRDLRRHSIVHTGERPFTCTLCDKSYTSAFGLQRHQLTAHQEQRKPVATKALDEDKAAKN